MTQSDQILEFIDGGLSEDAEQQLFHAMASERELRSELRQHVSISRAVQSDRDAFAPSTRLDSALLTSLGLMPAAGVAPTAGAGAAAGFLGGAKGVMAVAGAFVLGVILAGGGLYFGLMNRSATLGSSVHAVNTAFMAGVNRQAPAYGQPGIAAAATTDTAVAPGTAVAPAVAPQNNAAAPAPRVITKYVTKYVPRYINADGNNSGGNRTDATAQNNAPVSDQAGVVTSTDAARDAATAAQADTRTVSLAPARQIPGQTLLNNAQSAAPDGPASLMQKNPLPVQQSSKPADQAPAVPARVIAEARGQSAQAMRNSPARQPERKFPENFVGALYYNVDNNLSLGIEGGQERYVQSLMVNSNDVLLIEQRPLLTWGGVTARYTYRGLPTPQLQPFVQMTAGATSTGPMLRGRAGARYAFNLFNREAAVAVGAELSSLFYRYNGEYSASGRWGITYGLELGLW